MREAGEHGHRARQATTLATQVPTARCPADRAHVPTEDSSHRPKLVNATITASIQYWLRIAS